MPALPPLDDPIALIEWVTAQIRAGATSQTVQKALEQAKEALKKKQAATKTPASKTAVPWWVWALGAYVLLNN